MKVLFIGGPRDGQEIEVNADRGLLREIGTIDRRDGQWVEVRYRLDLLQISDYGFQFYRYDGGSSGVGGGVDSVSPQQCFERVVQWYFTTHIAPQPEPGPPPELPPRPSAEDARLVFCKMEGIWVRREGGRQEAVTFGGRLASVTGRESPSVFALEIVAIEYQGDRTLAEISWRAFGHCRRIEVLEITDSRMVGRVTLTGAAVTYTRK